MIVSNPPYIAAGDSCWRQRELRFEPLVALAAGIDGLDALKIIIAQASVYLKPKGWLFLEHGHDQGEVVLFLLRENGFIAVSDHRDIAGISRVSAGRWPS